MGIHLSQKISLYLSQIENAKESTSIIYVLQII